MTHQEAHQEHAVITQAELDRLRAELAECRRLNANLLDAAKRVLAHVEDKDILRIENQCTLCYSFRMLLRDAIEAIDKDGEQ